MDTGKLTGILQKISFLKTYSPLIIPLLIVGIGVGIFGFTYAMSINLKKEVNKESTVYGKNIASLMNSIPSKEQWKEEQKYQEAMAKDAERISLLPKETTQRELLSYKIFPKPRETSRAIFQEFSRNYRKSIEAMIVQLNARDCPTQAEINRLVGSKSRVSSTKGSSEMKDEYCKNRAKSISVYANPADVAGYTFWEDYADKTLADCWYWQLGYWIIEDVFKTLDAMNYGSDSVFTSPVKRIVKVDFKQSDSYSFGLSDSGSKSLSSPPQYITTASEQFTPSFTARLSNEEQDVVHFNVSVILDAEAIPRFMKELCSAKQHTFKGFSGTEEEKIFKHNQITILKMSVNPVTREAQQHQLYRYGNSPVIQLDLICEYIFIKAGYEQIKPEVTKIKKATAKGS